MTPIIPNKIIIINDEQIRSASKTIPMMPSPTFIDLAVQGKFANPNKEIFEHIDAWHRSDIAPALHKWLGMTWNEYKLYVENGNALPAIISDRRKLAIANTTPVDTFTAIYLPITFEEQYMIRISNYSKLPKISGLFICPTINEVDARSRTPKTSNIGFMAKLNVKNAFLEAYNVYHDVYSIPALDIDKLNSNIIGQIELILVS